jgi:hypothetical protein
MESVRWQVSYRDLECSTIPTKIVEAHRPVRQLPNEAGRICLLVLQHGELCFEVLEGGWQRRTGFVISMLAD